MIHILLVDDHDMVRAGLKNLLETEDDFQVVAEARNGRQALALAEAHQPDVVVMDITMPQLDGIAATRRLTRVCTSCRVLALTVHDDREYFFTMLQAGASGYLTKAAAADELIAAVRAVAAGHAYLQPALASWLLDDMRRSSAGLAVGADRPGLDVLSQRELQVLRLVAEGLTTPEIARQLELSPKTISRHRERIMEKLGLHSLALLVRYAIRHGLIEP
jgi:DNA-binding NarL/FixJ family response regulator